jgi:hypothetical protein
VLQVCASVRAKEETLCLAMLAGSSHEATAGSSSEFISGTITRLINASTTTERSTVLYSFLQLAVCANTHSDRRAIVPGEDSVLSMTALLNSFCTSIREQLQMMGFPLILPLAGFRSRLQNRAGSASPASSTVHKLACRRQDAYRFHAAKLPEASHLLCRWASDSGRSRSE